MVFQLNFTKLKFVKNIFYKNFNVINEIFYCHKVNKLLVPKKDFSTSQTLKQEKTFLTQRLENRCLIKLTGTEVGAFLQGLITNDIGLLEQSTREYASMYCMMLNVQGRVLYDLLLYKVDELFKKESSLIVECDKVVRDDFINILKKFKLRKKISISPIDEYSIWSVIPRILTKQINNLQPIKCSKDQRILFLSQDPRIATLGYRLICLSHLNASSLIEDCEETKDAYTDRCLETGLSEGVQDLPPANCFPLESNLVFLNGVSFNKGCYIGQELTARTHHTGVIRKRLMPLIGQPTQQPQPTTTIHSETTNKECGKVRSWKGDKGIGLLRLNECLTDPGSLILRGVDGERLGTVKTFMPQWWPREGDEVIKQILNKIVKK